MVMTIQGLKPAPGVPRAFGSEFRQLSPPFRRGDEVRCVADGRDIYVDVLGAALDGWLLGYVVMVSMTGETETPGVRIGDGAIPIRPRLGILAVRLPAGGLALHRTWQVDREHAALPGLVQHRDLALEGQDRAPGDRQSEPQA